METQFAHIADIKKRFTALKMVKRSNAVLAVNDSMPKLGPCTKIATFHCKNGILTTICLHCRVDLAILKRSQINLCSFQTMVAQRFRYNTDIHTRFLQHGGE